jgi:serine/threonine protein kinase
LSQSTDPLFKRYELLQVLGKGGMGTIFLAADTLENNAPRVIKQLISKYESEEEMAEALRLFKREARLLESLNHPGVVHFIESHSSKDGKHFLVMDYVKGSSLESVISDFGPFNEDDTIKVGIQICEVLEYLHEQNPPIIYRDLKPSNLMLTPEGQIIFIDFGIARTFMPKEAATRVVTAGYSPPEQYFGKPEIRSDLYAMGATLGHLLTGIRPKPLTASTPGQSKKNILPGLDNLVRRLTSHNIEERPPSARYVRHVFYRLYQELHPEFEIPEEVFTERTEISQQEQFVSQKIMRSGMAAASSAQRQEEESRAERMQQRGTSEQLREPRRSENYSSGVRSAAKNLRGPGDRNDAYGKSPRSSKGQMRSVKDLKNQEKSFLEKLLSWFRR